MGDKPKATTISGENNISSIGSPSQRGCLSYCGTIGGLRALIARTIKQVEVIAYDDLGTETKA